MDEDTLDHALGEQTLAEQTWAVEVQRREIVEALKAQGEANLRAQEEARAQFRSLAQKRASELFNEIFEGMDFDPRKRV